MFDHPLEKYSLDSVMQTGLAFRRIEEGEWGSKGLPKQTRNKLNFSLQNESDDQTIDDQRFDQGQSYNHRSKNFVGGIGIASNSFQRGIDSNPLSNPSAQSS